MCQISQQLKSNSKINTSQNNYSKNQPLNSSRNRKSNHIENEDVRYKIDLLKIDEDQRTTLMIANIPNKYNMESLMQKINLKGHKDKYDFFYVPVDLENECNKGYAFINLENTNYIKKFYQDFHNKRWKEFNSDKICQIKYASIQGIYEIIKHFMSASIMKDPKYKPFIKYDGINGLRNQQLVSNANQLWKVNLNTSKQ